VNIESKISLSLGLLSLIFIPYIYGIKIVDIILLLSLPILFLYVIYLKKIDKLSLLALSLFGTFIIISIDGAIFNTESYKGIFVAIRYFLVLLIVISLFNINKKYFIFFKKGFLISAYITVFWMIVDTIYYYFIGHGISINQYLFSNFIIGNEHDLTNRFAIGSLPLFLRASGFGWDPGGIAPALLIAYIINDFEKIYNKNWFLIIGIFLSISKTSILILFIYFIYKIIMKVNFKLSKIFLISIFIAIFIISSSVNGNETDPAKAGNIRHIKYPSSIIYLFESSPSEMLLGYGYRGTGEFFYKYVPWFKNNGIAYSYRESKNKVVESTFTNLFLYSGILGSAMLIFMLIYIWVYGDKEEFTVIYFLMLGYVGYTFENLWSNFVIFSIVIEIMYRLSYKKQGSKI